MRDRIFDRRPLARAVASLIRLVGALMFEQNDEWAVSRRYVSMESLKEICDDEAEALIAAE